MKLHLTRPHWLEALSAAATGTSVFVGLYYNDVWILACSLLMLVIVMVNMAEDEKRKRDLRA